MTPLQIPEAPDLFALVRVTDEDSFFARLKQLACDVYAGEGPFATLKDRIRHVITTQGYGSILTGRHPVTGKSETCEETFERLYSEPLVVRAPRGTKSTQRKVFG